MSVQPLAGRSYDIHDVFPRIRSASVLRFVLVLLVYVGAGKLGLALAAVHPSASAVWPATGIALGLAILWGARIWPAILIGAFLVNVSTTGDVPSSGGIAVGNTLEAVVGVWLIGRFAGGRNFPHDPSMFFRFCAAVLVAAAASATLGTTSLGVRDLAPWPPSGTIWLTWWLGDVTGAIIVTPILILWAGGRTRRWTRVHRIEAFALLAATLVVGFVIFVPDTVGLGVEVRPISFLTLPVVAWAAFRFRAREAASVGGLLSALAVWGTARGTGPFSSVPPHESLLFVQTFVAVIVAGGIPLAGAVEITRRSREDLKAANENLEARVEARTRSLLDAQRLAHLGSWEWEIRSGDLKWSDEAYRIFGFEPRELRASYEAFLERVHPNDRDAVRAAVERALTEDTPYSIEHRIVRPTGEVRFVHERGTVTRDAQGAPVRMVGTVLDVTKRRRAEERFRALVEFAPDALILVDGAGRIVLVNEQVGRLFGWERSELVGQTIEVLIPERLRQLHVSHRAAYGKHPAPRPMGVGLDLYARRKDGSEFPCEISLSPITSQEGTGGEMLVTAAIRDITDRKRTEERIMSSLREKESLLKEIHHRVKNNLQVISGLLSLQAQHAHEEESKALFAESRNRVKSMALVHEKLYASADLLKIDAGSYLSDLLEALRLSLGVDARIRMTHDLPAGIGLDAETAINLGLITNELISNAFKHAFPDGREGNVRVSLRTGEGGARTLLVEDDGVGFPSGVDFRATTTLGLQLVTGLTRQLGGSIELERDHGTRFRLTFGGGKPGA